MNSDRATTRLDSIAYAEKKDAVRSEVQVRFVEGYSLLSESILKTARRESGTRHGSASPWTQSVTKRAFDVLCVAPAILLLLPGILLVAFLVRVTSGRPVLFHQQRMGKSGRLFSIYKFRTMVQGASRMGPGVTKAGDPRLTRLGSFLRKHKLDEIPQLYNVLRGDMSLVGPRPKLPEFEHCGTECRPGVTGAATLAFANEEEMLRDIPLEDLDQFHIHVLSPMKREMDEKYQMSATFVSDLRLLVSTVLKRRLPDSVEINPALFRFQPEAFTSIRYYDSELSAMQGRPTA